MTETIYDVIIIGAGPGGLTAALYTSRSNLSTLLLDRGAPGGQLHNTEEIENYPGFSHISGPELAQHMFEHALKFGAEYKYADVKNITREGYGKNKIFKIDAGSKTYISKSIIIATGTTYRKLGVPGEQQFTGRGVSWCAVCDGAFYKDKHVVVVGGGDSAVEEAAYLTKFANKVTLLVRSDKFRAQPILVDRLLKNEKVEVKFNTVVNEIIGEDKVTGVKVTQYWFQPATHVIECDGVFEYVGMDPISDFAKDLDITDENGWIETNQNMKALELGVFAIGDIRKDSVRQVVAAAGDGSIAAQHVRHYLEKLEMEE